MGVYNSDRSSPKKSLGHRGGFSDIKRKLTSKRYLCLWVLVALVPCYLLRQAMSSSTAGTRIPMGAEATSRKMLPTDSEKSSAGVKETALGEFAVDVDGKNVIDAEDGTTHLVEKKSKEKSVLDFIFKHNTIKPAKYDKQSGKKSKGANSLKLRLRDNFHDDGDFGVAEDNDKAEEQMWTAPPVSSSTTKVVTKEER